MRKVVCNFTTILVIYCTNLIFISLFDFLFQNEEFTDVTLATADHQFKVSFKNKKGFKIRIFSLIPEEWSTLQAYLLDTSARHLLWLGDFISELF